MRALCVTGRHDESARIPGEGSVSQLPESRCRRARVAASAEEAAGGRGPCSVERWWVVKAQVHAGGRGKAGGVKLTRGPGGGFRAVAADMLGKRLITAQTGAGGSCRSRRVYVRIGVGTSHASSISRSPSIASAGRIALIASASGGMDIEEVAHQTPEKILAATIHPAAGPARGSRRAELAFGLGFKRVRDHAVPIPHRRALPALHRQGPEAWSR